MDSTMMIDIIRKAMLEEAVSVYHVLAPYIWPAIGGSIILVIIYKFLKSWYRMLGYSKRESRKRAGIITDILNLASSIHDLRK